MHFHTRNAWRLMSPCLEMCTSCTWILSLNRIRPDSRVPLAQCSPSRTRLDFRVPLACNTWCGLPTTNPMPLMQPAPLSTIDPLDISPRHIFHFQCQFPLEMLLGCNAWRPYPCAFIGQIQSAWLVGLQPGLQAKIQTCTGPHTLDDFHY